MAKKESTEVAKTEGKVPALSSSNPFADLGIADNAGYEEFGAEERLIPFLRVIQALSPQLKQSKPEFIPDAKEGMLCIPSMKKLFDGKEGIYLIPVGYNRRWNEWAPRASGGGLVNIYENDSIMSQTKRIEKVGDQLPNGNTVSEHRNLFGALIDTTNQTLTPLVISAASSQIKYLKEATTILDGQRLKKIPILNNVFKINTFTKTKSENEWSLMQFQHLGTLSDFVQQTDQAWIFEQTNKEMLAEFCKSVASGSVKTEKMQEEFDPETGEVMGETAF